MAATYQIWTADAFGNRSATISEYTRLSYARSANAVGALVLLLARDAVPDALLDFGGVVRPDTRIEVWRRPEGGAWTREGDGPWLVQRDIRGVSERGGSYRRLEAVSAAHLLTRRIIQAYPGDNRAVKTGAADDLMKAYAAQALGTAAGTDTWTGGSASRDWTATVAMAPSLALGPSVTKEASWRGLLPVLQELARDAATAGTPVYFDVIWNGTTLEFRTWIGQRGVNRTLAFSTLTLSISRGNLGGTVEVETDYGDVASVVLAGGAGQSTHRLLSYAGDAARAAMSSWGLREVFIAATQATTQVITDAEASAELRRRRPSKVLTGELISQPGTAYGVDWGFGDALRAEFEQDTFAVRADSVTVTVEGGAESITAKLTGTASS